MGDGDDVFLLSIHHVSSSENSLVTLRAVGVEVVQLKLRFTARAWTLESSRRPCVTSSCLLSLSLSLSLSSASKQFAGELLQCHNEYRNKHQAPPLKMSTKLSREAARWVQAHTD